MTRYLVTAIALIVSSSSVQASMYHHIDQLAVSIEHKARLLVSETGHYRHTREYAELHDDAVSLRRLVSHMHQVVHLSGGLVHLQHDVAELDARFHHIQALISQIEINASRRYGHQGSSHVRDLLDSMEDDIHHLQEDIAGLLRTSNCAVPASPVVVRRIPVRPVRPYSPWESHLHNSARERHYEPSGSPQIGRGGIGFSIGGGSSRLHIQF